MLTLNDQLTAAAKAVDGTGCEGIRHELERILASQTFRTAEAQKKFLRYVVEQTLEGRTSQIKEFSIGSGVLERGSSFDPRIDNIVRVEARKLRIRLARYYETEGAKSSLRILLPQRGYVPIFQECKGADQTGAADGKAAMPAEPEEAVSKVPSVEETANRPLPAGYKKLADPRIAAAGTLLFVAIVTGLIIFAARHKADAPSTGYPSIAVLPFRNLGDISDDSFSDGLTDELIDSLGSVPGLRVVARTSAFQFKSGGADIRQIGRKLNVRMILEGSVRQYGDQMRISIEMDNAANGFRIWSASYDRHARDALQVQREISNAVVNALAREFPVVYARSAASDDSESPVDPEAYRDYLRGVYFWNKNTPVGHKAAIGYLEQAIARDPAYARAYSGLARCYVGLAAFSVLPVREVVRKVRESAAKALQLDSGQGEAHIYLAYAAMLTYDWAVARAEFEKGLELEPGNAVAHRWFANYFLNVGEVDKALAENQLAESLDPVSPYVMIGASRVLHFLGRDDEAIAQGKKILLLDPNFAMAHKGLGEAYLRKGMYPEALTELKLAAEDSSDPSRVASLAYAYAITGHKDEARRLLDTLLASRLGAFPAKWIAEVFIGLGDADRAFEFLAKAIDQQDNGLLLKADPLYQNLRADPRFRTLLDRMRLS